MVLIYWNSTFPLLISCFLAGICVCVVQYDDVNFFSSNTRGRPFIRFFPQINVYFKSFLTIDQLVCAGHWTRACFDAITHIRY